MKQDFPDNRSADDAGIEQLLRAVGPRDEPSAEVTAAVRTAAHAEWRAVVDERRSHRSRRWMIGTSVAAGIAAAAIGITLLNPEPAIRSQPATLVASVAKMHGPNAGLAQVSIDGDTWRDLRAGETLASGGWIRTDAATSVALQYSRDASVRLDRNSLLRLVAADRIVLERGRLYIDVPAGSAQRLVVQTQFGTLEHIGTQYQAQLAGEALTVSVREGRVAIDADTRLETQAGEGVTLDARGTVSRETIAPHDARWQWAVDAAPAFAIEARTLAAFLDWIARETGKTVTYGSPAARTEASTVILHGSIDGLTPDQALAAVLATTRFRHTVVGATIQIDL